MKADLQILSLGTDENLLIKNSRTYERIKEYSTLAHEYICFVFTRNIQAQTIQEKVGDSAFKVIPIYGRNKLAQIFNLFYLFPRTVRGKKGNSILISQDAFEIGFLCYFLSVYSKWKYNYDFKLLIQMHTDISTPFFQNESLRNYFQFTLAKFLIKKANSIRVVSQKMHDYISLISPVPYGGINKVFLLPIYVDINLFNFVRPPGVLQGQLTPGGLHKILMISRIEEVKNIPLGIRAVQAFRKLSQQNVQLKIVGSGGLKEKYLKRYKSRSWIKWADWTENVEQEYHDADLLLITSNYEGWGLTAVESVACGTPVAISPVGVANEFIVDGVNGFVARGHDIVNIVEAIYQTLSHEFDENKMRQSLLKLDTKEIYFQKFEKLLEKNFV